MNNKLSLLLLPFLIAGLFGASPDPALAAPLAQDPNISIINNNNPAISYVGATWDYENGLAGYYNNDISFSAHAGDYMQVTFTGHYIGLIVHTGTQAGMVDIYIDNVLDETDLDLYTEFYGNQVEIYFRDDLDPGVHTLKVVVSANKNENSSGNYILIDAVKYIIPDVTWTCVVDADGCPVPNDPMTPYLSIGSVAFGDNGTKYFQARENCLPRMGCVNDNAVYYRVEFVYDWAWNWGAAHNQTTTVGVNVTVKARFGPNHTTSFDCQTGSSGSCSGAIYGVIPASEMNTTNGAFDIETSISATGQRDARTITWNVYYSIWPYIEDCASNYTLLSTSGPFDIDPTIETPLGSGGSPADEQLFTTTPTYIYAIKIDGGPWEDGVNTNRFDAAISWDGTNWVKLQDANALCISPDPANPELVTVYLQAESETLHIRANDNPTMFADNSLPPAGTFIYYVSSMILSASAGCDAQFMYDPVADLVATVTVNADQAETYVQNYSFVLGDWYLIETASGAWYDNGAGPYTDAQFDMRPTLALPLGGIGGPGWQDLHSWSLSGGSHYVWCTTDSPTIKNYLQAFGNNLYLRVSDTAETWGDNSGSLDMNIYKVNFTRRPEVCELQFGLDSIGVHGRIPANWENGTGLGTSVVKHTGTTAGLVDYPLEAGAWYMLDITGGPWGWVGTTWDKSYASQIKDSLTNTWVALDTWAGAACNVAMDALGHRRLYFQIPAEGAVTYTLRVADTSMWINNTGSLEYDLYKAFKMAVSLPGGGCDYTYDPAHPTAKVSVAATNAEGSLIASLASNTLYALYIHGDTFQGVPSQWAESTGGPALYDTQISDDNGTTWHDLPGGYAGVLCYFQVGNNLTIYLQTGAHYQYKWRVNSTTFGNNTGQMAMEIFSATAGDSINNWSTCIDGLNKTLVSSHNWIDVRKIEGNVMVLDTSNIGVSTSGQTVPVTGFMVEIESGSGPWHKNDGTQPDDHFDAALSNDNGDTWHPFDQTNSSLQCVKTDMLGTYQSAYFTFIDGQQWRIRVNDGDAANFTNNSGNLSYALYAVTGIDLNNSTTITGSAGGLDICGNAITTPDDILDVSGWIMYATSEAFSFLAWCPIHTDKLLGMLDQFKTMEPIATLNETEKVVKGVKDQVNGFNWNDSSAPDDPIQGKAFGQKVEEHIFPGASGNNPWNGGPLVDFQTPPPSATAYGASCSLAFKDDLGKGLADGLCFVSNWFRETGGSFWVTVSIDVGAIFFGVTQIWSQLTALANFMAGSTGLKTVGINIPKQFSDVQQEVFRNPFPRSRRGRSKRWW